MGLSRKEKTVIGVLAAVVGLPVLGLAVAVRVAEVVHPSPIIRKGTPHPAFEESKRIAYAESLETEMLERGIDAHVSTSSRSFNATTLFIDWPLCSRPAVFNFMRKNVGALKEMGFREVQFRGYDQTWTERVPND